MLADAVNEGSRVHLRNKSAVVAIDLIVAKFTGKGYLISNHLHHRLST